jgi:hypothetical protein
MRKANLGAAKCQEESSGDNINSVNSDPYVAHLLWEESELWVAIATKGNLCCKLSRSELNGVHLKISACLFLKTHLRVKENILRAERFEGTVKQLIKCHGNGRQVLNILGGGWPVVKREMSKGVIKLCGHPCASSEDSLDHGEATVKSSNMGESPGCPGKVVARPKDESGCVGATLGSKVSLTGGEPGARDEVDKIKVVFICCILEHVVNAVNVLAAIALVVLVSGVLIPGGPGGNVIYALPGLIFREVPGCNATGEQARESGHQGTLAESGSAEEGKSYWFMAVTSDGAHLFNCAVHVRVALRQVHQFLGKGSVTETSIGSSGHLLAHSLD